MARGSRPKTASAADASRYLGKAVQFQEAAETSSEAKNWDAMVGNAVNAGILAASAFTAKSSGQVWTGEHEGAVSFVEKMGPDGKSISRNLHRLLGLKSRAQYDPQPSTSADAKNALKAAKRIIDAARPIVEA